MPASVVAGEGVQLVDDHGFGHPGRVGRGSERLDTSITSIDSGVVNSRSGRSRMIGPPAGCADVPVPQSNAPSDQGTIGP